MADWVQPYAPVFDPQGDTTSVMLDKLNKNQNDVYAKLNRVRKLDAGNAAPSDPIDNHLWLALNQGAVKRWNGTAWARATVIGVSKETELIDAINGIGTQEGVILISEPIKLTADREIPENIQLKFLKGAYIDSDTTVGTFTLIVNGGIDAGLYRIFGDSLTVAGSPKVETVYSEWWGAKGDGTADDTQYIRKALNFYDKVSLVDKTYKITDIIDVEGFLIGNIKTKIVNYGGLRLLKSTNDTYFKHSGIHNLIIENFSASGALHVAKGDHHNVRNVLVLNQDANSVGVVFKPFENYAWIENFLFENVKVVGGKKGFKFELTNTTGTFINVGTFINCETRSVTDLAIEFDITNSNSTANKISNINFIGCEFDCDSPETNNLIYCKGNGVGRVEFISFDGCALEDTHKAHSVPVISSEVKNKLNVVSINSSIRYNFTSLIDVFKVTNYFNFGDSTNRKLSGYELPQTRKINTSTSNVSYFSANQSKAIHSLTRNTEVWLIILSREYGGSWGTVIATRGDSASNVAIQVLHETGGTFSLSGTDVVFTNTTSAGSGVRITKLRLR